MLNQQHSSTLLIPGKNFTIKIGENTGSKRKSNAKPTNMHASPQFNALIIKPSIFYFNKHVVRVCFDENDQPLFCMDDVCKALNMQRRANLNRYKFDPMGIQHLFIVMTNDRQLVKFINEENLYRIVFRSTNVEAYSFQHWLLNELMPKIRKTINHANSISHNTYEEINRIYMDDLKSRARSTVHSYGLHRRKLEKHLNALRMKICIANLQLAFDGFKNDEI